MMLVQRHADAVRDLESFPGPGRYDTGRFAGECTRATVCQVTLTHPTARPDRAAEHLRPMHVLPMHCGPCT